MNLAPAAARSCESRGRMRPEEECSIRVAFQRDRDRITHCKTFRRLKYKTQVFLTPAGDHYRTRLTHVLEVSQIARTISVALRLNGHLTEAIALGHDLGHTPFGHAGETVLNQLHPEGFRHYQQSLRVVDLLEHKGRGLNLSWEVRDGIVRHSKGRGDIFPLTTAAAHRKMTAEALPQVQVVPTDVRMIPPEGAAELLSAATNSAISVTSANSGNTTTAAAAVHPILPATLEGQAVRVADIIAYVNHDLDDAVRAGLLREEQIPADLIARLGATSAQRVDTMVRDLVEQTLAVGGQRLTMSPEISDGIVALRNFLFANVYENYKIHADFVRAMKVVRELYHYFMEHDEYWEKTIDYPGDTPRDRMVCDYVAGMTDRYALDLYKKIFLPAPWSVL